jgi:Zn-dependent metalloprotease
MRFLGDNKKGFGVTHAAFGFARKTVSIGTNHTHVRAGQEFAGLPVFAGETIVQLNQEGRAVAVFSDLMRDEEAADFERTWKDPSLTAMDAQHIAVGVLAERHPGFQFQAEPAVLMIYAPSVVGNGGPARLVWHTTVASLTEPAVAERVLVDACSGEIALRCSLLHGALSRKIYDAQDSSIGTLMRIEGMGPSGLVDVDKAYDYLGDADFFYRLFFGRNGVDNAGMPVKAFVRACYSNEPCPWPNAAWVRSPYNYFVFGKGYVADDVVAHEFTHAVIEYTCGLESFNEAGAINESLADGMGELNDQRNGLGSDSDWARWLIGEDLPGGPGRNMKNPSAYPYNDADCKGGVNWRRLPAGVSPAEENDYGYVHSNAGVGDKLWYLLTDGDTFNGYTISRLGSDKVTSLLYEAMKHLTAAADYEDLYLALIQAANNLGWTWAEKQNLEFACRAVEIAPMPVGPGISVEVEVEG